MVGGSDRPFVGRGETLRSLESELAAALNGQGAVALVAGEPGIGKTRCAEEFAQIAEDQGALVVWGRCYEHPGAPPYWPWIQILREYADANSEDELRVLLSGYEDVISALAPEIGFRLGFRQVELERHDSPDRRFHLFDSIGRIFARAVEANPLVVVLDDLHWADPSSLSLLEFLTKHIREERMMILCAYRDVEVARDSPLLLTLGELGSLGRILRVRLDGLDAGDTGQLAAETAGLEISESISQAIFNQTDGNPLFVSEVAKEFADVHRRSTGDVIVVDVPNGIRETIGRRLSRLSSQCNEFLSVAAVYGREFDVKVVLESMQLSLDDITPEIESAVRAGIIQPYGELPAVYRFSHAVIRETLYDELPRLRRLQLHQTLGETIAEINDGSLSAVISQLAHHFCQASALGYLEAAVGYCLQAAEQAERLFAYAEAINHYDDALRMLQVGPNGQDPRAPYAHFRKGRTFTISSRFTKAVESFAAGSELALKLGMPELFADCITESVRASSDASQQHRIPLLKDAIRILPESDLHRRSIVMAHLAFALRSAGDLQAVEQTGNEGIALARELGDPTALAIALRLAILGLRGEPATLRIRVEYGREMVALSASMDDPEQVAECWYWQLLNLIESGEIREFSALLDRYTERANTYHLQRHDYQAEILGIALRLLRGEWEGTRERIETAYQRGSGLARREWRQSGDGAYGAQMFVLNRDQGTLGSMRPFIKAMMNDSSARYWAPGLILLCCEVGLLEAARETMDTLAEDGFAGIAHDDMWLTCIVFCAEACAYLQDVDRAKILYPLLLPYAHQTANHPPAVCFGSASRYLGILAQLMGQADAARGHFENSIERNRRMGAWPALARAQLNLAHLLASFDSEDAKSEGRQLLVDAEQLAGRFRMAGLQSEIAECRNASQSRWPDDLTDREVDVLKLLAIGRSNKDISKVLTISLSTVATHVRSILSKTGSANRTEAAAYAMREKLN